LWNVGKIATGVIFCWELLASLLLTVFSVKTLRSNGYVKLSVIVKTPTEKKQALENVDELPVV